MYRMNTHTKPTFDAQSRNGGACSLSGLPQSRKRRTRTLSKQDHEIDEFVITLTQIEHEGDFDVLPSALREVALEYLDLVPESSLQATEDARQAAEDRAEALQEELAALQGRHDALTAELSYVWQESDVA